MSNTTNEILPDSEISDMESLLNRIDNLQELVKGNNIQNDENINSVSNYNSKGLFKMSQGPDSRLMNSQAIKTLLSYF